MTKRDDSFLDAGQLANVQLHVDRLLRDAGAYERFPTAVDDIMAAAKLTVVDDEVLDEGMLRRFLNKVAKVGRASVKAALSKVLGLFESQDRLVVIDKDAPKVRKAFIKLHEAGHGTMPHQSKVYQLIHDCEQTLAPDITDLFEREANVFASEALFQGEVFAREAHGQSFSMNVPIALAKKFGASNYSSFRRYVSTNPNACCVVVLEPGVRDAEGVLTNVVRRVVASASFTAIYDGELLCETVTTGHPLASAVPRPGKRMRQCHEIVLMDRNNDERLCIAEAFDTRHQVLVLVRDMGRRTRAGIVLPPGVSF